MDNGKHIFLSYRSTETDFALRLAAALKNAGVNLWVDRLDIKPGDDWRKSLQSAVNDCAAMISVLTPDYVTSRYCQRELARADRMGRPIIPVLLRPVPETDWPFEIERQQYIDFTGWRDDMDFERQLQNLVEILQTQFAEQVTGVPDPETRYLTSLIAELEASKGVMEYVELPAEAGKVIAQDDVRPRPRFAEAWSMQGAFSVVQDWTSNGTNGKHRRQAIPLDDIRQAVDSYPRFVLIGPPGAGKTTTLHHLVLSDARARQNTPRSAPLPLLLKLTRWTDQTSIEEFIRAHWPLDCDPMPLIAQGQVSLYLDGLNEMGSSGPAKAALLRAWLASDDGPRRIVVTCRAADYRGRLTLPLPTVQASDMDRPRIEQFVRNYLGEDDARALLNKLMPDDEDDERNPLFQLARNPFLLGAFILLHQGAPDAELPTSKGALLKHMAAEMWKQQTLRRPSSTVPRDELEEALAELAYSMVVEDMPIFASTDYVLQHLHQPNYFQAAVEANFLALEGDNVRFSHQLMQEYFAALGLWRAGVTARLARPRFDANGRRVPTKWDPIIVTLSGISANADAIVRAVAEVDPFLALECVCSGIEVSEATYRFATRQLNHVLRSSREDGRVAAAEILAALRDEAALPLLLRTMRDGSWEIRQAATAVLKHLDVPLLPGLTQTLEDLEHDIRDATATAVRQLGETALPTLLQLLDDERWSVRRSALWALGETRDAAAVPALVEALYDEDALVSAQAAKSLGWIKDPVAVTWLAQALRHENWRVRKAAAGALGWIGVPALDTLLEASRDPSEDVRRLAVDALKNIRHPAVLPAILQATYDPSAEVRSAAVEALRDMEDARAVKRLIELLSDTVRARWAKQRVSDIAARILESIGTREALAAVARWRKGEGRPKPALAKAGAGKRAASSATTSAASSAPKKSAPQVKERLKNIRRERNSTKTPGEFDDLYSPDWSVRRTAVLALAKIEPGIALPKLRKALDDEDNQVRLAAVQVLSGMRNPIATEGLLHALGDQDFIVCDAAAESLRIIGSDAIPGLVRALDSQNLNMRGAAIEVLGKIGDVAVVPNLIGLLNDTGKPWLADQRICDYAARALLALGTPEAVSAVNAWRATETGRTFIEQTTPRKPPTSNSASTKASTGDARQHKQILTELLESVREGEWGVRQEAAKALREYAKTLHGTKDSPEVDRLIEALGDPDWSVRFAVAEALAWIGDTRAVPALVNRLSDDQWMVRVAVIRALTELGDTSAAPAVIQLLNDRNNNVREAAAEALGVLADKNSIPALQRLASDDERFVRLAVTDALGRIGDPSVYATLISALGDEDMLVRWSAAESLGRLGVEGAVPELINHLQDTDGPHWEDKRVCDVVADALLAIGTDEAKAAVARWRETQPEKSQ